MLQETMCKKHSDQELPEASEHKRREHPRLKVGQTTEDVRSRALRC